MHSGGLPHTAPCRGLSNRPALLLKRSPLARCRQQPRRPSAVAAEPAVQHLQKSDLVQYMRSGCRPKEKWRYTNKISLFFLAITSQYAKLIILGDHFFKCLEMARSAAASIICSKSDAAPIIEKKAFPSDCYKCRFGTEHEKLGYNLSDNRRIDYNSIRALLEGLCNRFGWEAIMEGEYIIGAVLDGQSVTIEPGGQFELSGAPVDTLHKTCSEVNSHLYQARRDLSLSACGDAQSNHRSYAFQL